MKTVLLALATLFMTSTAMAQHEGHNHDHKKDTVKKPATTAPARTTNPKPAAKAADDHSTHQHGSDTVKPKASAPAGHDHGAMGHDDHSTHEMTHAFSRNLPMNRNGSGTGWLPDNAPMYGYMFHTPKWMYMVHGNLFLRYNKQDLLDKGSRGDAKFDAPNWVMAMGQRTIGSKGLFRFRR
jgi:hypothetical protein